MVLKQKCTGKQKVRAEIELLHLKKKNKKMKFVSLN